MISWIIDRVWDTYIFFLDAFYVVSGWVWPLSLLATPFSSIANAIYGILWPLYDFQDWVGNITARIAYILSWGAIQSLFLSWFPWLPAMIDWFLSRWAWFITTINEWWGTVSTTVEGWIATATEGLSALKVAWDNFWVVTFPTLLDWFKLENWWSTRLFGIDKLINDTIKIWFPFYDELVSLWNEIKEFFVDPVEYVYNQLDEFFERFW